jgi:hypothetical protein
MSENPEIAAISEDERFVQIAENSNLSSNQMLAALLESVGCKPQEISRRMGKSTQWVYQMRLNSPDYPSVVRQLGGIVAKRIVTQVSDIDELFNGQIRDSAATLIQIRDNDWAKDSDRIKASLAFLDRAPKAPKVTRNEISQVTTIQIPLSSMAAMQQALEEDRGSEGAEILELSRILTDSEDDLDGDPVDESYGVLEDEESNQIIARRIEVD